MREFKRVAHQKISNILRLSCQCILSVCLTGMSGRGVLHKYSNNGSTIKKKRFFSILHHHNHWYCRITDKIIDRTYD